MSSFNSSSAAAQTPPSSENALPSPPILAIAAGRDIVLWDPSKECDIITNNSEEKKNSSSIKDDKAAALSGGASGLTSSSSSHRTYSLWYDILDVTWNHDGRVLAASTANDTDADSISLVLAADGTVLETLWKEPSSGAATSVAFGGKSRYLCLTSTSYHNRGICVIWDMKKAVAARRFMLPHRAKQAYIDPTDTFVCSLTDKALIIHLLREAKMVNEIMCSDTAAPTLPNDNNDNNNNSDENNQGQGNDEDDSSRLTDYFTCFGICRHFPHRVALGTSAGDIRLIDITQDKTGKLLLRLWTVSSYAGTSAGTPSLSKTNIMSTPQQMHQQQHQNPQRRPILDVSCHGQLCAALTPHRILVLNCGDDEHDFFLHRHSNNNDNTYDDTPMSPSAYSTSSSSSSFIVSNLFLPSLLATDEQHGTAVAFSWDGGIYMAVGYSRGSIVLLDWTQPTILKVLTRSQSPVLTGLSNQNFQRLSFAPSPHHHHHHYNYSNAQAVAMQQHQQQSLMTPPTLAKTNNNNNNESNKTANAKTPATPYITEEADTASTGTLPPSYMAAQGEISVAKTPSVERATSRSRQRPTTPRPTTPAVEPMSPRSTTKVAPGSTMHYMMKTEAAKAKEVATKAQPETTKQLRSPRATTPVQSSTVSTAAQKSHKKVNSGDNNFGKQNDVGVVVYAPAPPPASFVDSQQLRDQQHQELQRQQQLINSRPSSRNSHASALSRITPEQSASVAVAVSTTQQQKSPRNKGPANNNYKEENSSHVLSIPLIQQDIETLQEEMQDHFRRLHVDILKQFQAQSHDIEHSLGRHAETMNLLARENLHYREENKALTREVQILRLQNDDLRRDNEKLRTKVNNVGVHGHGATSPSPRSPSPWNIPGQTRFGL